MERSPASKKAQDAARQPEAQAQARHVKDHDDKKLGGAEDDKTEIAHNIKPNEPTITDDTVTQTDESGDLAGSTEEEAHRKGEIATKSIAAPVKYFCQSEMGHVFRNARKFVKPTFLFRMFTHWYAERKLVTVFWVHFVATMVVWTHFALVKNEEQKNSVPEGAPNYYWKRLIPPLEFGSMHAILFQMALLPMTMSRLSIAFLSTTSVQKYFPFDRMLRIHIHLGYTMVGIVFLAVLVFFTFFGHVCRDGEDNFCDKFTEEIMITGYVILGMLLLIGGTSFFRHNMNYDLFYRIHHIVFLMYLVTIVHTQDNVQRDGGRNRSQTFKWFSATILYYVCDRIAMASNHRYRAQVAGLVAMTSSSSGGRMIKLVLRRPVLFDFQPGQYAFLRIGEIEAAWHPFSIASGPESEFVEFYIEVFRPKSWTGKLWDMASRIEESAMCVEIQGPYGTPLAKTSDFSHALAVGSGTGVVPLLSLLKQHVRQLLRLEPTHFLNQHEEQERKINKLRMASAPREGSAAVTAYQVCCNRRGQKTPTEEEEEKIAAQQGGCQKLQENTTRSNIKRINIHTALKQHSELVSFSSRRVQCANLAEIKRKARFATLPIYGIPLLGLLSVLGVLSVSLTLSFNLFLKHHEGFKGMDTILQVSTVLFQALFTLVTVCLWPARRFLFFVDLSFIAINFCTDWYFFVRDHWTSMTGAHLAAYFVLMGYMTARVYVEAVGPRHNMTWRSVFTTNDGSMQTLDRLDFVWVTRSASLAAEVLPDLYNTWSVLVSAWGKDLAQRVCRISIYVTDANAEACDALQAEYGEGDIGITLGRPDFPKLLQAHTIDLVCSRTQSHSILAFCGSPQLARELHGMKLSNDVITSLTGNSHHSMEFVSESYGGSKSRQSRRHPAASAAIIVDASEASSERHNHDGSAPSSERGSSSTRQRLTTHRVFSPDGGGDFSDSQEDLVCSSSLLGQGEWSECGVDVMNHDHHTNNKHDDDDDKSSSTGSAAGRGPTSI